MTRGIVRRFIAGVSVKSAMAAALEVRKKGFRVSLDCLGEHVRSEEEADAAAREYLDLLQAIADSGECFGRAPENINISIKLSQLGLNLNAGHCVRRLETILLKAAECGNFVRIDMEESAMVDATLQALCAVWPKHKNVGIVLQSMLKRTPQDLETAIRLGVRVRLVKGAYLEESAVAHQEKAEVDKAYLKLGKQLLKEGCFPAFGTHDGALADQLAAFAARHGIGKGRFEFQMLYGIHRKLQERLLKEGYIVRIYIPYGKSWYPYFSRRLAERPANLLFFIRSLFSK